MVKPNNYDEVKASGEFTPVELGGHKMVVKKVEERMSSTNKPMIVVFFDFDKSDVQPDYFMESYKNDIRPDKKWSNQATQYILSEDQDGKCSRSFKTFCSCIENSNPGFSCWKSNNTLDLDGLKNKKIGGIFGEQMDYYNGEEKKKRVLRWFVSIDKVASAEVPAMSYSSAYRNRPQDVSADPDGFMNIPDGIEDLPFN